MPAKEPVCTASPIRAKNLMPEWPCDFSAQYHESLYTKPKRPLCRNRAMDKNNFIDRLLPFVEKASRYLGSEVNSVKKDLSSVDITFVLAFPDVYEVGMSHMGLHILYHVLNRCDRIACERSFMPWPDMERLMIEKSVPLATLESFRPLKECDIVGFSLEYELSYATVIRMLNLAGIPPRASARDETAPLIIAGGPSTYNPEPVADFFDAFIIGEGEETVVEVSDCVAKAKKNRVSKAELLHELSGIPGVYVPSFFSISYTRDGRIREIAPRKNEYSRVMKRAVSHFSGAPFYCDPIVPYMQIIHDRAAVEIARGCSRGCRFCMAGMIYRPVREKNPDTVCSLAGSILEGTGYEELALASLSSGDYTRIADLLGSLMHLCEDGKIALSFPSLRVESLTADLIKAVKAVRKTGFTIAPEAGTQRLRDAINKCITEEAVITTAQRVFDAGWNLIKLYFMIGLPTETDEDIDGIIALSKKIAAVKGRRQVTVSLSTFVPKPNTPFQWESQIPTERIQAVHKHVMERLTNRNIKVKWHDHRLSFLEGVFSRGDRRLGPVILEAVRRGAGFEAWSDLYNHRAWDEAFRHCGLDPSVYLRGRELDEILPWQHISCGIDTDFLKAELGKSRAAETTPDCRTGTCTRCGACSSLQSAPELCADHSADSAVPHTHTDSSASALYRYRLCFSKTEAARFLSHLEMSTAFARSMRRAGLPLRYSQGYHPHPRIVFHEALPVGMESLQEYCDVELTAQCPPENIITSSNRQLPAGLKILSAEEIRLKSKPAADRMKKYTISFPYGSSLSYPDTARLRGMVDAFSASASWPLDFVKKGKKQQCDVRSIVHGLAITDGSVVLELLPNLQTIPRIQEIIGSILNLDTIEQTALKIVKLQ